jgi:putative phosphoesterase
MTQTGDACPKPIERIIRVGLISDTHGVFHDGLAKTFSKVDAILHAGDVGSRSVLERLEDLAPVHAVMGNVDSIVPELDLPVFARLKQDGIDMLVTHYIGEPTGLLEPVAGQLAREPAHVVVSGHTHRPALHIHKERLFVNPGSAGSRRYGPATCALLMLTPQNGGAQIKAEVLNLDEGGAILEETLVVSTD